MQVLEDCAAGDNSNFDNSQDVLDYPFMLQHH